MPQGKVARWRAKQPPEDSFTQGPIHAADRTVTTRGSEQHFPHF